MVSSHLGRIEFPSRKCQSRAESAQTDANGGTMKFGLFGGATAKREDTADSQGYHRFVDYVIEAEDLGFSSVFLVEHHFTGIGQVSASLQLLSYLAARTDKLRLGTAVTTLPWHNPVLLAEQVATIDLLSNGRLDFGVGKGYRDLEFKGFCIDRDEANDRYRESLEVMIKAWTTDERFSYHGRFWNFEDVIVEPATVQKPYPPIWSGAGTPESISRAVEDGFNVLLDQFANVELTAKRAASFRHACAATGRAWDPMELGLTRALYFARTKEERDAALDMRTARASRVYRFGLLSGLPEQPQTFADQRMLEEDAVLIGTPDDVAAKLEALRAIGIEYVLFTITDSIDTLRTFARDVMPAFAGNTARVKKAASH
jgi:alkanesulfonate monooxygenase SsuD/methylene tetrahydromethanopterin reductase-like flavin-dependent oxidoreductase (luciferase family)